ncbi:hypothetical protein COCSADRAFT_161784 [Bipolaris sorokiniana ND90Pr]|uniref:Uncharacterized protein n=1 Tax=Cochliobolus sativus (strain ND90Pr / ATCC 201652) TaxID=665912 RepID=M2SLU4_COCSN|nr:uncharacterized protein COCSADRAFT_161784 [Bipolaris sorokiniana ND90Pr]EMD63270.1 hypothetical protein COCSADRAFT_161784 [Bipolaris sorokiniana ND90Pr]
MDEASKQVDQYGRLREAAHQYFCSRNGELGKHPHVLLDLIVTSANTDDEVPVAFLCNGESRNLKELQLAVFLQASVQGQRLCKHYGFETINTVKFSRANYRLTRTEVMSVMI